MSVLSLVAMVNMVMFAILSGGGQPHTRSAYRCAMLMAACWLLSELRHTA